MVADPNSFEGNPENKEPQKCDHVDWYDLENLPDNTLPHVKFALTNIKNKIPVSELRQTQ